MREGFFYVKTHWGMHYECDDASPYGTKIREPKKFKNGNGEVFVVDL